MFAVVVLEGVASPIGGFEATMRDVSGERSGAFVPFGSARRATARDFGLGVVAITVAEACEEELGPGVVTPLAAGWAIRPTALGVGVDGGRVVDFWVRLFGVDGASMASAICEVFLLRDWAGATAGGGMAGACALRRADLRLVMMQYAIRAGFAVCERVRAFLVIEWDRGMANVEI